MNRTQDQSKPIAIASLLAGKYFRDAAADAGVTLPTLRKWLKLPSFKRALRRAQNAMIAEASHLLAARCVEAVDALVDVMKNTSAPAAARVNAASRVLELSLKIREQTDLVERLEELEKLALDVGEGEQVRRERVTEDSRVEVMS